MLKLIRKLTGQGCSNCGDTVLLSCKVTDETHRYTGELSRCGTCGLVSSDMKLITENRVIVPHPVLHAVDAGPAQVRLNVIDRRLAILVPSGKHPRAENYEIVLGTTFHGDLGVSLICDVIYPLLCVANSQITNCVGPRISIGIEGYNDDPREIWELPSIIELFGRINDRVPAFIFWLTDAFRPVYLQVLAAGSNEETVAMTQAMLEVLHRNGKMPAVTIPTSYAGRASFFFLLVHAASRAKVVGPQALESDLKANAAAASSIVADGIASLDRTLARYQRN